MHSTTFFFRWSKNFKHECTYKWDTFQLTLQKLADPEYSHNKILLVYPANVVGDTGKITEHLEPNFSKIFFGDLRDKIYHI
jgi:hypothetical protein